MVALPPQLFYNTQIPACLWFINRSKPAHRRGLFIDARRMGHLITRTLRELSDELLSKLISGEMRISHLEDYENAVATAD